MRLRKDNNEIILHLKEQEYLIVLHALKAATGDDKRKGLDYWNFYTADKSDIVKLHNEIDTAEQSA